MRGPEIIVIKDLKKTCGDCTACCSGALHGEAYGHKFFKGRPCFFVTTKGCSIYESRPEEPCQNFRCGYLSENFFPEWMRPDLSKALSTMRVFTYKDKIVENGQEVEVEKSIKYLRVFDYQNSMDTTILMWFIEQHFNNVIPNLIVEVKGKAYRFGSSEFLAKVF